jgi:hypothetical protein
MMAVCCQAFKQAAPALLTLAYGTVNYLINVYLCLFVILVLFAVHERRLLHLKRRSGN